jgi:hypothetical protein
VDSKEQLLALQKNLLRVQELLTDRKRDKEEKKELVSQISELKERINQAQVELIEVKSNPRQETNQFVVSTMEGMPQLTEEVVETRETLSEKLDKLDTLIAAFKSFRVDIPKEVKVSNISDTPKTESVKVSNLSDIKFPKQATIDLSKLEDIRILLTEVSQGLKDTKLSTDPEDPIAVRLSNGKEFYDAVTQVFGTGGGGSVPKINMSGTEYALTTSGLSLPRFDYVALVVAPATTETYTFKVGGASGNLVATVVIVYTDATKAVISTVTKT